MDQTRKNTISVLTDLLRICELEHSLFLAAAERSYAPKLKTLLYQNAQKKETYASKLKNEILRLGENPENISGNKDLSPFKSLDAIDFSQNELLLECINSDSITIQRYSKAIKEDILWEVIPLVAKQYFDSINSHDQMMNYIDPVQNQSWQVAVH